MTEERQEKNRRLNNRKLAEWLGFHVVREKSKNPAYRYKYKLFVGDKGYVNSAGLFGHGWHSEEEHAWFHAPDFYTSEDASALLLDKMLAEETDAAHDALRRLFRELLALKIDRKAAIAEACSVYIDSLNSLSL